jgi:outer membrane protein assembly factor BamB
MSKPAVRLIVFGLVVTVVAGLAAGYRSVVANLRAPAQDRVDDALALAARPEAVEAPRELATVPNRSGVPPDDVGRGWPALLGPAGDCSSPERGLDWQWAEAGPPLRWRRSAGAGYSAPVLLGERLILFHRLGDREVAECLSAETGEPLWSHAWPTDYECPVSYSSGPYSTPVLEEGRVYALGAEGRLCCLDLDRGELVWQRDLHRDYDVVSEMWPATGSPLVEGDRLIVNVGGRSTSAGIVALDCGSGETAWSSTDDGPSCSTPVAATIHGGRFVFVWTAEALVSLDPADGRVFWRIPFAANNREAAHGTSPLVVDDVVIVSGYQIGNLCVRVMADGSPKVLWRDKRQLLDSQYNNLTAVDGRVCGFSATRRSLRCLDIETGEMAWQWRSKIPNGTMLAVDGRYLLLGARGRLAALAIDTSGVEVLAMTSRPLLGSPCFSYPALHNGLLYVRNEESLLCVDLRRPAE